MRADRPLLGAILFLACGLGLILGYCNDATSFTAAFPFNGSTLHIDVLTNGPAAVGGVVLTAVGLLLLLWAVLAAIVGQIVQLFSDRHRDPETLLDRESLLE
jgi:nitrogen fixation-related uncharacterized protein